MRQIVAPLFYVDRIVYFCGMNLVQFAKDWTLPVSMGIGALAYFIFAFTPALHEAALFFDPIFDAILPLFMFMILFVTFCKVDFKQMKTEMWHLWIVLLQVLLVLIVVGIILLTEQTTGSKIVWEGILTCIICPTAAAAAVITVKLGGNLGSMTTYTFISSFVTAILIPTFFPLIEKEAHLTFWDAFLIILNKVCLVLVLPLFLGWFVRHFVKPLHDKIVAVKDMGFYMWGISLSIVTGTTIKNIVHADVSVWLLLMIAFTSAILCVIQFALGKFVGKFYGSTVNAGQALGQKNTAFAIWITYTYLNPVASVGPGCYILWQNTVNSIQLWMKRKEEARRQEEYVVIS